MTSRNDRRKGKETGEYSMRYGETTHKTSRINRIKSGRNPIEISTKKASSAENL